MTNNHGTLLLFAEAKILVDEIVFLMDRYEGGIKGEI